MYKTTASPAPTSAPNTASPFQNSLAGVVIDRFGKDAMLVPDGNEHFTFTTEIVVSPVFYGWLAGFGERAEILFPESVRAEFAAQCRKTLELYK